MKIKVIHKFQYGHDRFFPADEWTSKLLSIFRSQSNRAKGFTKTQMQILKELGFQIEMVAIEGVI